MMLASPSLISIVSIMPCRFHEDVLAAMATPATSHLDPVFINIFGETIEMLRQMMFTKTAQPFVVAGSGTLGWDMVRAAAIVSAVLAIECESARLYQNVRVCRQVGYSLPAQGDTFCQPVAPRA